MLIGLCQQWWDSLYKIPERKVHGTKMGPTWVLSAPEGPHVGPMNLAIRDVIGCLFNQIHTVAMADANVVMVTETLGVLISLRWEAATEARLTHWGRVKHMCASKLNIIRPNNDLSPGRRQPNAGIMFIRPIGTNFSEIWNETHTFPFNKMHLKMSCAKWRQSCLGLNVFNEISISFTRTRFRFKDRFFRYMNHKD